MDNDIAISLKGVKKQYRLGQIGGGTLQGDLQSWWARKRGKEDPNSKIDTDQRLIGQTFMALNGIDLEVKKGEALGIIGKNGAGKSTLLKLLCRVTGPTEGVIDIYGRITSMLEVGTGFHGEMTGRENVYMNGAILGMTKEEIDAKMDQIIEFSEVGDFIDTPVKRYSSGMYVKLAFSVAAHLDSEIMIMDEVLAVGDMAFQKKCLDKMSDASRTNGKTVLYVSHNMSTIKQLCTRCIVLNEGRIVYDGDVDKAIDAYLGLRGSVATHYFYDQSFHTSRFSTDQFVIKESQLLNTEDAQYELNDSVSIRLTIDSKKEYKSTKFRFVITRRDGTKVATMFSDKDIDFPVQDNISVDFKLDLTHITSGAYRIDIIAFQYDSLGHEQIVDGVYPGIIIEVDSRNTLQSNVKWLPRYWGNVRLQDVVVSKVIDSGK